MFQEHRIYNRRACVSSAQAELSNSAARILQQALYLSNLLQNSRISREENCRILPLSSLLTLHLPSREKHTCAAWAMRAPLYGGS